jgi:acetolactate synthase-1/2/3 large subunit
MKSTHKNPDELVKVSDLIADFFVKKGIDTLFTVTGGGAMHLNDSFGHHKGLKSIYHHHEQACAMAAEGYARIKSKPGLICVTSGPATTNTLTGVLGAWLDSVPMIIISGQMKLETTIQSTPVPLRQLGFQEFNIIDSVKNLTKYSELISDPKYILYHLERAFFEAENGRKGPVWLDIPLDIQSTKVKLSSLIKFDSKFEIPKNTFLNDDLIKFIFNKVNSSIKPVILAGYGVRMEDSYDDFIEVVNLLKIPVLTEWNSNDLITNTHDYFGGRPGTIGDRGGNFTLQSADLVIAVGCQLSIRQISYVWSNFAKNAEIIGVNIDKFEMLKPTIKIHFPINISVTDFCKAILSSKFTSIHNLNSPWLKWVKKINSKYPVVLKEQLSDTVEFMSVYGFMKFFSDNLENNAITVLANGAACVAGLQVVEVKDKQRIFTNAGASSMGYAICAAIGAAAAAQNNQNIYCIEGDGSIQMNLQELQTIVHNNLNIKIFWINNDGYHSIKQTQIGMFKAAEVGLCGADKSSGISFPSAEKISKAYDLPFFKIDSTNKISETLEKIRDHKGPLICEVVTDPNEIFQPKLQSKMLEDGTFYTPSLEDMFPFLSKEEIKNNKEELESFIRISQYDQ